LGYSPWRRETRPGRLVWHAFWTFSCQFSLLTVALCDTETDALSEPSLLDFMATMPPRVEACFESLMQFDVAEQQELDRCRDALSYVKLGAARLTALPRFAEKLQEERLKTASEYHEWARLLLDGQESGPSSSPA